MSSRWNIAWITGASSGIGRALALRLAGSGVQVAASARSADKLAELEAQSDNIRAYVLDVTDAAANAAVVAAIEEELGPIDLAVLNAGYWHQMGLEELDLAEFRRTVDVNLMGVANGIAALAPAMTGRGRGQIAVVGSISAYVGLPQGTAYGATKAALLNLCESLKPDFDRYGVTMSIINPSFVETPMTDKNDFDMPMIMGVEDAVDRIVRGLERKKFEIYFPWRSAWVLKLFRRASYPLFFLLIKRLFAPRLAQDDETDDTRPT